MTLREALATAFSQFYQVADLREEALQDATFLLLSVLAISRATLLTNYDRVMTPDEEAAYRRGIARRMNNEPLQYIAGECEFYGLPFQVNPAVLIPRSLTEHLVEAVIDEMRPRDRAGEVLRIVDVGTGSGAIAIALAHHLPNAQLTAVDLSTEALEVAASNAKLNGLTGRIRLLESDLLSAVAHEPAFDAVVSNPPYIPGNIRKELKRQIRDFEPGVSLFAGPTGLEIYHRLIPDAHAALKPHGLLAFEMGPETLQEITALLSGWDDVHFVENLHHVPRIAVARKP